MDEKSVSKHAQFVTFGTRFHREEPIFSYIDILQKCSSWCILPYTTINCKKKF